MTGENEKVAIKQRHIDAEMRDGLASVEQHNRPGLMSHPDHFPRGIDCTKRIRGVDKGDNFCARTNLLREVPEINLTRWSDVRHDNASAGLLRRLLPGDDVRVVFHAGEQDLIAFLQPAPGQPVSDEINPFSRAPDEDNIARRRRTDKMRHFLAGTVVGVGSHLTQIMHTAVDIPVLLAVIAVNGLEHLARFLRGCRIVEVNQGASVDRRSEDRKVRTEGLQVPVCHGGQL